MLGSGAGGYGRVPDLHSLRRFEVFLMTPALLFLSTFAVVFCLGMQSLLVNHGYRVAAFVNSFLIGVSQLILYKLAPDASGWDIAGFLCGGPFGIVTAMAVFRRLHMRRGTQ